MSNVAMPIQRTSTALNYVTVNGVQSPGVAQLTGVRIPYKWDVQQQYGREGAATRFIGRDAAKFTLTLTLFDDEDFLRWPIFAKVLEPPSKLKPFFVEMQHPLLSSAGITAVGVESFGQPERQPNGRWIATIQLIEYRKPRSTAVQPRGSIPGVAGKPIPPKTAGDIALEEAKADLVSERTRSAAEARKAGL